MAHQMGGETAEGSCCERDLLGGGCEEGAVGRADLYRGGYLCGGFVWRRVSMRGGSLILRPGVRLDAARLRQFVPMVTLAALRTSQTNLHVAALAIRRANLKS